MTENNSRIPEEQFLSEEAKAWIECLAGLPLGIEEKAGFIRKIKEINTTFAKIEESLKSIKGAEDWIELIRKLPLGEGDKERFSSRIFEIKESCGEKQESFAQEVSGLYETEIKPVCKPHILAHAGDLDLLFENPYMELSVSEMRELAQNAREFLKENPLHETIKEMTESKKKKK